MQITRRGPASTKQMLRAAPASMVTIMDGTCLGSALPGRRLVSPHTWPLFHVASGRRSHLRIEQPTPGTRERGPAEGRVWEAREELVAKGRF